MDDSTRICVCGWIDVLEDQYQSVLFLVEINGDGTIPFNSDQLNQFYLQVTKQ